ncbi:C12orf76 isoform 5 [Pelobates cultripes]|uniref:C12orf76 isoform 5 n=1 Tax=Pelobates cultripes TaxID=61616 RepID=A0AAD1SDN2_PELCU|nr:C12orf76 isoform 5 [Pelobates cultripes]
MVMELVLLSLALCVAESQAQADVTPAQFRPYVVLLKQNMVLLGSILSILLIAMIILAVCVYKPIRRR